MKIYVQCDPLPIPIRSLDYVAWSNDQEISTRAATAGDAVELLMEQLPEEPSIEVIIAAGWRQAS